MCAVHCIYGKTIIFWSICLPVFHFHLENFHNLLCAYIHIIRKASTASTTTCLSICNDISVCVCVCMILLCNILQKYCNMVMMMGVTPIVFENHNFWCNFVGFGIVSIDWFWGTSLLGTHTSGIIFWCIFEHVRLDIS